MAYSAVLGFCFVIFLPIFMGEGSKQKNSSRLRLFDDDVILLKLSSICYSLFFGAIVF